MESNEEYSHARPRFAGKVLVALGAGFGFVSKSVSLSLQALLKRSQEMELPSKHAIDQIRSRFDQQGLIRHHRHGKYIAFELTEKGRQRLEAYMIHELVLPSPPQLWDGQWRIVLFDVPEERKHLRAVFRRKLQSLGFRYLQRSSWIYPFPCEDELRTFAERLHLTDVVVVTAQALSNEAQFLGQFNLSRSGQTQSEDDYHFVVVGDRQDLVILNEVKNPGGEWDSSSTVSE